MADDLEMKLQRELEERFLAYALKSGDGARIISPWPENIKRVPAIPDYEGGKRK